MNNMLKAEAIHMQYGRQPILNGVSLCASGGEVIGIAGLNGSGKSTLLSVLTGITRPGSGRVELEAQPLTPASLRKWVGYVPQENSLFENLSALDNIKLWASAYAADWRNALPFLFPEAETGTDERAFLKKKVRTLSGGMKKRLSIAVSLMHNPKYLVMDEPTAGLDIGFRWNVGETVKQLRSHGRCVIFTSHQADELLLCDRIYVLREGAFVYVGSPEAIRDGTDALHSLIAGRQPRETVLC
jgi:ABC-2 type transport system ATP-binding protein